MKGADRPHPESIPLAQVFLFLLLIQFVGLRMHFFGTGYYLDDWWEMSLAAQGTYWEALKAFANAGYWDRPFNMLLLTSLHKLSGVPDVLRPWVGQVLLTLLGLAEAWLLFLLLDRLTRWRSLALTAVGLILLFPNRAGMHYRITLLCLHFSIVFILASLHLHLRWWNSSRRLDLAGSQALYIAGLLFYESPMFMPFLLAGAIAARDRAAWKRPRKLMTKIAACLLPYGLSLTALLLWKWVGMQHLFGITNMKAAVINLSLSNAVNVFIAGLGCDTLWPLSLSAVRLLDAIRELGWLWILLPVFVVWLAKELRIRSKDRPANEQAAVGVLMGAIGGGYIGTYAPYVLSDAYLPHINGIMSRLNGTGAWVGGMIITVILWFLQRRYALKRNFRRHIPVAAMVLILSAFTWTNWTESLAWAEAWRVQRDILSRVAHHTARLKGSTTIMLMNAPRSIHGAPVFYGAYDFRPALSMTTGRMDLGANVVSSSMKIEGGHLVQRYRGKVIHHYLPSEVHIYDYLADELQPSYKLRLRPHRKASPLEKLFLGRGMEW